MKLPDYLFISSDGHMYDTRRPDWSKHPLRYGYADTSAPGTIGIRAAIRNPYAWPGGYALFAITSDGACLCMTCCRKEYRLISDSVRNKSNDGWRITAFDCTANVDEVPDCDHCSKPADGSERGADGDEVQP